MNWMIFRKLRIKLLEKKPERNLRSDELCSLELSKFDDYNLTSIIDGVL